MSYKLHLRFIICRFSDKSPGLECNPAEDTCVQHANCVLDSAGTKYTCLCDDGFTQTGEKCTRKHGIIKQITPMLVGRTYIFGSVDYDSDQKI